MHQAVFVTAYTCIKLSLSRPTHASSCLCHGLCQLSLSTAQSEADLGPSRRIEIYLHIRTLNPLTDLDGLEAPSFGSLDKLTIAAQPGLNCCCCAGTHVSVCPAACCMHRRCHAACMSSGIVLPGPACIPAGAGGRGSQGGGKVGGAGAVPPACQPCFMRLLSVIRFIFRRRWRERQPGRGRGRRRCHLHIYQMTWCCRAQCVF